MQHPLKGNDYPYRLFFIPKGRTNFFYFPAGKIMFLFTLFFSAAISCCFGQQTIFSQDFGSSTTTASYVSATPNSGQFDAITTAGTTTATINSGALRFTRGNSAGSFTRS